MTTTRPAEPIVVYVDIDDTLVRSFGSKRIPMRLVVDHVRSLKTQGAELYAWSRAAFGGSAIRQRRKSTAGAEYARKSAEELGIGDCFTAFLPKPHVMLDDQPVAEWRRLLEVHPNSSSGMTVMDYHEQIEKRRKQSSP